ncbi:MAG: DUF882 domain-containing protein [Rhizobiaceae bacterium]|nr:DUF882 domain-containing protein [Rhizobiaceae bacterium]
MSDVIDRPWLARAWQEYASARRLAFLFLAAALLALASPVFVSPEARAETRTLKLYYTHTREKAEVTFKRNGRYLPEGLKKANHMMRDWRRNQPTKMDPKLLDLLWEVYKEAGARDYIHIVSGYRSPATNAMLRRTRGGQAEKSQHMVGKAVDFFIPGVKISKLRAIALRKQGGGVGYYPRSGSPFVHIDTGRVRHWPRMSRSELVAVFPNGKTLHVPSDGKPLPGYEAALAAYKANGRGDTRTQIAYESDKPASSSGGSGKTLLGMLFGGGADESEDEADAAAPVEVVAEAAPKPQKPREPEPVDVAALQPAPMEVVPVATQRPVPPAEIAATPEPEPAPEPLAEYAALPNRGAPIPSPAPRAVEPEAPSQDMIAVLAAADVTPAARPEQLAGVADAAPNVAALAPAAEAETGTSPFDALLPGEAPVPQARPDIAPVVPETNSGEVAIAALAPAEAEALAIDILEQRTVADDILAPVPSPRPADAPASARTGRVSNQAVPAPTAKAERVTRKPSPAVAALAPATGAAAATAPKAPRVVKPVLIPQLPADSSRFGPRAAGGAGVAKAAPVQKIAKASAGATTQADENAKALDRMATASVTPPAPTQPGMVLEDGSVLIKSGKIPVGN